jgi:hypothetical protein
MSCILKEYGMELRIKFVNPKGLAHVVEALVLGLLSSRSKI